jgi:hypothetical protein
LARRAPRDRNAEKKIRTLRHGERCAATVPITLGKQLLHTRQ